MGGHGSTRWNEHIRRCCIGETTRALTVSALRAPLLRLAYLPLRGAAAVVDVNDMVVDTGVVLRGQLVGDVHGEALVRASLDGWITSPWGAGWVNDPHDGRQALSLRLVARVQPRGGLAWLVLCPRCGRRCRTLYGRPGAAWGCRTCLRLRYHVQRMMSAARLEHRAAKLREAVGGSWWDDDFPNQPAKGRWRSRFEQLRAAHDDVIETAEALRLAPFVRWMDRWPPFVRFLRTRSP